MLLRPATAQHCVWARILERSTKGVGEYTEKCHDNKASVDKPVPSYPFFICIVILEEELTFNV